MKTTKSKKKGKGKKTEVQYESLDYFVTDDKIDLSFLSDPLFEDVKPNFVVNERRDRIVLELFETEQAYVKDLFILVNVFRAPLASASEAGAIPLDSEDLQIIFSNVQILQGVNQALLRDLKDRIMEWSNIQCIGDALKPFIHMLKSYNIYSTSYDAALKTLRSKEKKKTLMELLEFIHAMPVCAGLGLAAYLIKPIQRIPRYRMLIEDFIKNTENTHPDYVNLVASLDTLIEVADEVNKSIAIHEESEKLLAISKKVVFEDSRFEVFAPGRLFIKEGVLYKVCRKENKRRYFFLFNDVLLYAVPIGNKRYQVDKGRNFDLVGMEAKATRGANLQNAIQITTSTKSFVVCAETPEIKEEWLTAINEAINDIKSTRKTLGITRENTNSAPVWVPDKEVKVCTICAVKFTFTNRRHHCRQCGNVVCGACSGRKKELPPIGKKRVCDECFGKDVTETNFSKQQDSDSMSSYDIEQNPVLFTCNALYAFDAPEATPPKLSLKVGDLVEVLKQDTSGWWLAFVGDNEGWVPASYLDLSNIPPQYAQ